MTFTNLYNWLSSDQMTFKRPSATFCAHVANRSVLWNQLCGSRGATWEIAKCGASRGSRVQSQRPKGPKADRWLRWLRWLRLLDQSIGHLYTWLDMSTMFFISPCKNYIKKLLLLYSIFVLFVLRFLRPKWVNMCICKSGNDIICTCSVFTDLHSSSMHVVSYLLARVFVNYCMLVLRRIMQT